MRIVVVGAGVVGLACAYELLLAGHDVTVVDRGAAGQAASHGNAAKVAVAESGPVPAPGMVLQGLRWMLRPDSPLYVRPSLSPPHLRFLAGMAGSSTARQFRAGLAVNLRWAATADEIFDEWRAAGVEFELHQRGVLITYDDPAVLRGRLSYQDVFDAVGWEVEVLDAAGAREIEPALSALSGRLVGALHYPADRQIEPDSLTASLAAHVTRLGGTLHEHTAVSGFDRTGGAVSGVRLDTGERVPCDRLVLAAGPWTGPLSAELGNALPIHPGKGYSLDFDPPPVQLRHSLTLDGPHVAVTPLDGMVRVAGTMEFSGFSTTLNRVRLDAIRRAAHEAFEGWPLDAPHRPAWAGMRAMSPDGLPVIGPLHPGSSVIVASGHNMLGLTMAPTTARAVRDLVDHGTWDPAVDPGRFRPGRRRPW